MITLEGVSFRYAGARGPAVRDIDLELRDGEVTALMGPDGAGKSTLCLLVAGLVPRVVHGRLEGRILADGEDLADRPMHAVAGIAGICLADPGAQRSGVCPTAWEEAAFGAANLGVPADEVVRRVDDAFARLRLGELAARDPARLSGGQQQLVAIAGLLAMGPRHLVLDEPTAQLDPEGSRLVLDALASLAADGTAILVAGHRTDELAALADRAVVLADGRIAADGAAADVLTSPLLHGLGLEERWDVRLARRLHEAGVEPAAVFG